MFPVVEFFIGTFLEADCQLLLVSKRNELFISVLLMREGDIHFPKDILNGITMSNIFHVPSFAHLLCSPSLRPL